MKIFISWSGDRSHEMARALGPWMKKVVQSVDYWISSDMERGIKWLEEINKSLDAHSFGILCVTPGNFERPWLNFEAGALSKHLGDEGRVIPYLLGFEQAGDLGPPLGQFNVSLADEAGTWEVIKTVNAHAEFAQREPDLQETFDMWWPSLATELERIKALDPGAKVKKRTNDEKLDELLTVIRRMERNVAAELGHVTARLDNTGRRFRDARNSVSHDLQFQERAGRTVEELRAQALDLTLSMNATESHLELAERIGDLLVDASIPAKIEWPNTDTMVIVGKYRDIRRMDAVVMEALKRAADRYHVAIETRTVDEPEDPEKVDKLRDDI